MKAVFLDRDGVINKYPGDRLYVTSWRRFAFIPRAKKAIAALSNAGFGIFVISNQGGVQKKIFSQRTLDTITKNMLVEIERSGGRINAVYYCTHRKEEGCSCRKPKPGLLKIAQRDFGIDLKKSFFVGDSLMDIQAALACGCTSILVLSGREKLANKRAWEPKPHIVAKDLYEAAQIILGKQ
ncbi:MAG: HAD family hydrolase [Candidatus Omnitrophica bacterium]|nr:HAD family hydrolase [Candidatus Omnitrophota bacterium]